jgi:hypothetical protein
VQGGTTVRCGLPQKGSCPWTSYVAFITRCDLRKTNCSSFVFHDGQDLFIVESIEKARSVS